MAQPDTAKCPHCRGWAFEPEHYPMKNCTVCGGTGRKPDKLPLGKAA